jgi:hypothetical protein
MRDIIGVLLHMSHGLVENSPEKITLTLNSARFDHQTCETENSVIINCNSSLTDS